MITLLRLIIYHTFGLVRKQWVAAGIAAGAALIGNEQKKKAAEANANTAWTNSQAGALRNRRFQRHMSNTAHQREVRDLKKAGLNPITSAGGKGASTPAGAPITGPSAEAVNPLEGVPATALSYVKGKAEIESIQYDIRNKLESWLTARMENDKKEFEAIYYEEIAQMSYERAAKELQLLEDQAKIMHRTGEMADSDYGRFLGWLRETSSAILGGGSFVPRGPRNEN